MAAIRLIPKTDTADFPYRPARELLESLPGVVLTTPDFEAMIEAGRRRGWSEELIRGNEALAERGNCLDFEWEGPPALSGSLYEDNVFFVVTDAYWETLSFIKRWAADLDVRVHEHDPPARPAPNCPSCGHPLRSAKARQCFKCGADWH